jgi:hypothetical protein
MTENKDLLKEGKRHRVVIANKAGKRLIELPLIWAVIMTLVAPQFAVLVVILALLETVSVGVERVDDSQA